MQMEGDVYFVKSGFYHLPLLTYCQNQILLCANSSHASAPSSRGCFGWEQK